METLTVTALFRHVAEAESAIGRLEVAGLLPADISMCGSDSKAEGAREAGRIVVTATVELRLLEKAKDILNGEGLVESQAFTK